MNPEKQCIADQIELHVRHILDNTFVKFYRWTNEDGYKYMIEKVEYDEVAKAIALGLTKELRGELIVVGKSPRSVAAGIVIFSVKYSWNDLDDSVTSLSQLTDAICEVLNINEVSSVNRVKGFELWCEDNGFLVSDTSRPPRVWGMSEPKRRFKLTDKARKQWKLD